LSKNIIFLQGFCTDFLTFCKTCGGVCRLLSEAVRRMTHEDIISLARAEHGHPMKLIDLAQVCFLLHTHICIP
jgi:hypothetical protein